MECLLLLLLIYLASIFSMYKWVQIAFYHTNGIFRGVQTNSTDLFVCFMPGINTICGIGFWIIMFPIEFNSTNNFFKPKNK